MRWRCAKLLKCQVRGFAPRRSLSVAAGWRLGDKSRNDATGGVTGDLGGILILPAER